MADIQDYLEEWRRNAGVTIEDIDIHFGNSTPHHWFDRLYGSYPTREDWLKIKEFLGFDDKYDHQMTQLYDKPAEKQNDPRGKNPGDVLFINPKPFAEAHFATFPEDLPMTLIKCGCPVGGLVYDPFFGSGTVGVAAEKLNRRWMGSELNSEYIEIARKRLEPYKNTRIANG